MLQARARAEENAPRPGPGDFAETKVVRFVAAMEATAAWSDSHGLGSRGSQCATELPATLPCQRLALLQEEPGPPPPPAPPAPA